MAAMVAMVATGVVAMAATARGRLSPATAVDTEAMVATGVVAMAATATARGLLSPATAMRLWPQLWWLWRLRQGWLRLQGLVITELEEVSCHKNKITKIVNVEAVKM